jgi:hypothetical protein
LAHFSTDVLVFVSKVRPSPSSQVWGFDSGQGCLQAVVLCGTDRVVGLLSHSRSCTAVDRSSYVLVGDAPTLANAITGRQQSGERLKAAYAGA